MKGPKVIGRLKECSLPAADLPSDENALAMWTWSDGQTVKFTSCTVGAFKLKERHSTQSAGAPLAWEGVHKATQHKISVAQRVDRSLLLSVYEQDRQILMLKMNLFAPIENEHAQVPPDHPAAIGAYKFLIPIAKRFANDEIAKTQLKEERDKALAAGEWTQRARRTPTAPTAEVPDNQATHGDQNKPDDKKKPDDLWQPDDQKQPDDKNKKTDGQKQPDDKKKKTYGQMTRTTQKKIKKEKKRIADK